MPRDLIQRLPTPLPLDGGGQLAEAQIAYELHGEIQGGNAVLLLHSLGRSHRCTGPGAAPGHGSDPGGWWDRLVGPGKAFDTETVAVISANLLGSPFGSTSPLSVNPATGRAWAGDFPALALRDLARAAVRFVQSLGIKRLRAVAGPALGGMVALELAAQEPELAGAAIAVCAAGRLSPSSRGRLAMARAVVAADPSFKGGHYDRTEGPVAAVKRLWLEQLREAYDPDWLARRIPDNAAREAMLEQEASSFAERFDANCFLALAGAAAGADVDLTRIGARVLLVPCATDAVCAPSRVREAYHALVAAGVEARYHELVSDAGHRAWFLDAEPLVGPIREFLG